LPDEFWRTSRPRSSDLGAIETVPFIKPIPADFAIPAASPALVLQLEVMACVGLTNAGGHDHERGVRVRCSWLVKTAHFIMER
jgi:hypothetical protein